MSRKTPYKLRAIVENGEEESVSFVAIFVPYISERTKSLIVDGINFLDLVGRLDPNGMFRQGTWDRKTQKSLSYDITKLNPRVIILEDGRLFYNRNRENPRGGRDFTDLRYFLQNEFAKRPFSFHFNGLFGQYSKN